APTVHANYLLSLHDALPISMSPPFPPLPPSGPTYSMNFSRRKLTAPGPPAPERRCILAWSRKCIGAGYSLLDQMSLAKLRTSGCLVRAPDYARAELVEASC